MSKNKPWPTVANRHRVESIMLAGEIIKQIDTIDELSAQLLQATESHNIALALAITRAIEGHALATREKAKQIIDQLESAPAAPGDIPEIVRALAKVKPKE